VARQSRPDPHREDGHRRPRPWYATLGGWLDVVGPSLLWMGFLYLLSTDVGSAVNTEGLLVRLIRWLLPSLADRLSPETLELVNGALRKVAHGIGYAVLGALDMRASWRAGVRPAGSAMVVAWLASVAYAVFDELVHQAGVPSRTGTPADVALDTAGAAVGVILYAWWTRKRPRPAAGW